MYHGGTNFGRTSGLFVTTSYDFDAPIDEYGLKREPKWGHLRDLHKAIKLCEPALISADPNITWLGKNLEARVFKSSSGACAAFLANYDTSASSRVTFWNTQYDLPPWSISILPDCKSAIFNTARIGVKSVPMKMTPVSSFLWLSYKEEVASGYATDTTTKDGLIEQVNFTWDSTDYLWYMTDIHIDPKEGFLMSGQWPLLSVSSAGHVLHVFVNGQLSGTVYGSLENTKLSFSKYINLIAGVNKLSMLSVTVGLPNVGLHFESWNAGVLGPVTLKGLNEGTRDMSRYKWSYKVGLKGELMNLYSVRGSDSVQWAKGSGLVQKQPLTWYKTIFNAPGGNEPLALDMSSMGKGQIWINGRSIGRYWPAYTAGGSCGKCNYAGIFTEKKCLSNCGEPSQKWYHVPREWLEPNNLLVVFEEFGGDPGRISLVKRSV